MNIPGLGKPVVVQKFGGTTFSGLEALDSVTRAIRRQLDRNRKVVAVVSAMGRGPDLEKGKPGDPYATDTLLHLLPTPPEYVCLREKDLMMMCGEIISAVILACHLRQAGITARARTGFEAGIITDEQSGRARIQSIVPDRLLGDLEIMDVVVVAGFQGISRNGKITTLGRGGSDTTAIVLGHALHAEEVEIFTDQQGVFSADPREVPEAVHLERINPRDIVHMTWAGAKVLHPRAAEILDRLDISARVGRISAPDIATRIDTHGGYESNQLITAVAHGEDVTQFTVARENDADQTLLRTVFETVTGTSVSMDMFTVTETLIRFTVASDRADLVHRHLTSKGFRVDSRSGCRKVSIVGAGMHGMSGVMARFTAALVSAGISIYQTVDSHATISALVPAKDAATAQQVLHKEFIAT
ncbi:MAG TPA: aspartate kinase [bacterium]|nr:aspartate kinase [bacterium]